MQQERPVGGVRSSPNSQRGLNGSAGNSLSSAPVHSAATSASEKAASLWPEFLPQAAASTANSPTAAVGSRTFAETLRERFELTLTAAQCAAIFADGDLDNDGSMSKHDFVHLFAGHYSTLLDIMYYRWRDSAEMVRLRGERERVTDDIANRNKRMMELKAELTVREVALGERTAECRKAEEESLYVDERLSDALRRYTAVQEQVSAAAHFLDENAADVAASKAVCDVRREEEEAWRVRAQQWSEALRELEKDCGVAEAEEERLRSEYEAAVEKLARRRALLEEARNNKASCDVSHQESLADSQDAADRFAAILRTLEEVESEWKSQVGMLHLEEGVLNNEQRQLEDRRRRYHDLCADVQQRESSVRSAAQELDCISDDLLRYKDHQERLRTTVDRFIEQRKEKAAHEGELIAQELVLREERKKLQLREVEVRGNTASLYRSKPPY